MDCKPVSGINALPTCEKTCHKNDMETTAVLSAGLHDGKEAAALKSRSSDRFMVTTLGPITLNNGVANTGVMKMDTEEEAVFPKKLKSCNVTVSVPVEPPMSDMGIVTTFEVPMEIVLEEFKNEATLFIAKLSNPVGIHSTEVQERPPLP